MKIKNIEHRVLKEIKDIFGTTDVFWENEIKANKLVAATMLNTALIFLIAWILNSLGIFHLKRESLNYAIQIGCIGLIIPAVICFVLKGKKKWLKSIMLVMYIIVLAMIDGVLTYNVALLAVIPVVLSCRYYSKKFTLSIASLTLVIFLVSACFGFEYGTIDLNYVSLDNGKSVVIENNDLEESVKKVGYDGEQYKKNNIRYNLINKFLIFSVISAVCVEISKCGRDMVLKQDKISRKETRIKSELELANNIQTNMLPNKFPAFPEHKEFDIYAMMTPAKEVGGDFYDMFMVDKDNLAIVIADVSGKGIPAALFMAISKALIKRQTQSEKIANKTFNIINNILCEGNEDGIFVTAWLGILNIKTGKVSYANAGHNPPLLIHSDGNTEYIKEKSDFVLGGIEDVKYHIHELSLTPGDKILLYTDGVTEATNENKDLYGEERLKSFLQKHFDYNIKDTLNLLKDDIDKFVMKEEQFDDITMLELEFKGKNYDEIIIDADINNLHGLTCFIEEKLKNLKCPEQKIMQIDVAIEEIFVNIAHYAYKKSGKVKVIFEYNEDKNEISIIFKDKGIHFNPLEKETPNTKLSIDKRKIGGLGIHIVKKSVDDISYKFENGENILKIIKKI